MNNDNPSYNLELVKKELIEEIDKRVEDKILEPTNANLLKKLIKQADNISEAMAIAELGTTYKKTGFHFDKRLEKLTDTIKYFSKNEQLSFKTDKNRKTHKLIIGDNYSALLNLLVEYRNKIDVIYIDPPYGKDSMGEFAHTNYENNITRDNLLSMLYLRLILAKQLLSSEGVIFCSIDDRNQAYVKILFDEVFGENNFIACFIWETTKSAQGMIRKNLLVNNHEYILCYAKNSNNFNFLGIERNVEDGFDNPDNDPKGAWKRQYLQRIGQGFSIKTIVNPSNGKSYSFETPYTQDKLNTWIKEGIIIFPNNDTGYPARKEYLYEYKTNKQLIDTLGLYPTKATTEFLYSIFNGDKIFSNPKPHTLIKFLVKQASKNNSIILDFFAGSGTTGQAVLELNKEDGGQREFILCQLNEITDTALNGIAYDITAERLKRVMTGKSYSGESNFKWLEKNKPLGDNLDVYEIKEVNNFENRNGETAFDVIDETLYGEEKFKTVKEKIEWVVDNFENTQKQLESDKEYKDKMENR